MMLINFIMFGTMKNIIIVLVFVGSFLFACDGDCMKCHPSLLKKNGLDTNHKVLETCITCHQTSSDDLQRMGAMCGQDCWDCHSIEKVQKVLNPAHIVLNSCIDCHKKLDKKPFYNFEEFPSQTHEPSPSFLK
jgi:hypothetical protein